MIIPWEVDAPHERWPVTNWLIIFANVAVFVLQGVAVLNGSMANTGITSLLLLDGWHWRGLFGHMWLHGGIFHLIGNMLFLWIFGNAVCATMGNLRYLFLYVFWGLCSGVAHLLTSHNPAIGASGAINGVVGMFLFLYAKNQITCLFWFFLFYVKTFSVSSYVMILWWLAWDVFGPLSGGGGGVAYCAHLGGFLSGFVTAYVLCLKGWVTLLKYEESLLDIWRKGREPEAG